MLFAANRQLNKRDDYIICESIEKGVVALSIVTSIMLLGTAIFATLVASVVGDASYAKRPYCKPTQSCWPSASSWAQLNSTVGGRLIKVFPLAKPCFDDPTSLACQEVQPKFIDPVYRSSIPGAAEYLNWESCGAANCELDLVVPSDAPLGNCSLGRLSVYAINVQTPLDVTAAILFARLQNIKIAIKNTGHDTFGRASAPDSLLIWTHNLKKMSYVENLKIGKISQPAFLFGSGVQAYEATAFADAHNKTVVQGNCLTVGVTGGWFAGGGKGTFGPLHGLGAENVIQFTIVTADGVARTLNSESKGDEGDLFWAVRGGGGGNWGVVTEVVMKAHPKQSYVSITYSGVTSNHTDRPVVDKVMKDFITALANVQAKVTALSAYGEHFFNPYNINGGYSFPGTDVAGAKKIVQPVLDILSKYNSSLASTNINIQSFPSFAAMTAALPDTNFYGFNSRIATRFIPKKLFASNATIEMLADALIEGYYLNVPPGSPQSEIDLIASVGVGIDSGGPINIKNRPSTAVHPAWSDTFWQITYATGWTKNLGALGIIPILTESVSRAADPLRKLTPGGGTYYNEGDVNEADWQGAFFGSNYPRLLAIKNKWDPSRVFNVWKGVGWVEKQDSSEYCYYESA
ncbi:hypothetical protein BJ742DRAFT_850152 [Cladochytrium replicatum]|nr:hypothetical protein BJ742DRAFT_850152 [Cladochytrium replicatum]